MEGRGEQKKEAEGERKEKPGEMERRRRVGAFTSACLPIAARSAPLRRGAGVESGGEAGGADGGMEGWVDGWRQPRHSWAPPNS